MAYNIHVRQVEEQPIAVARRRTDVSMFAHDARDLMMEVENFLERNPNLHGGPNISIYYWEDGLGEIEVGTTATQVFPDSEKVVCSMTPAGIAAVTTHYGSYDKLYEAHDAIRAWCEANKYEPPLRFWEVYGDYDEEPLRVDVFHLLKT